MSGGRGKRRRPSGHPARTLAKREGTSAPPRARPKGGLPRYAPKPGRRPARSASGPSKRSALAAWFGRKLTSVLSGRSRASRGDGLELTELTRVDAWWAAGTAAAATVLFATVLTGHPGLGDAPETVAGVSSLGILHDPGYPTYVLAAKAFTLLVPIGSEAFRVNLFSLVCASATVAVLQLLSRRCGAARWAASLGALAIAATAGFWFYAGFAKHDIFSGLLFLLALYLVISWAGGPSTRKLIAVAVVLGLGLGSSWPLMMLVLPTVAYLVLMPRRRPSLRALAVATGTGLVVIVAAYGFVMLRASENPALNWGDATTLTALKDLVLRSDFTPHGSSGQAGSAHASVGASPDGVLAADAPGPSSAVTTAVVHFQRGVTKNLVGYGIVFGRELGVLGAILAAFGLVVSLRNRRTVASYPLLLTFGVGALGAAVTVGAGLSPGTDVDLVEEGFVMGCYFVLACWVALGATDVVAMARARWRDRGGSSRRWLEPAAAAVLGLGVLVPSIAVHWTTAHRASQPFADRYARTMFASLPPRAALFVWGAELTQPLIYRQVVYHERPDVTVVAADGLTFGWYRAELSRRLGRPLPGGSIDSRAAVAGVVRWLSRLRPVYLDPQTTTELRGLLAIHPTGLLAQPVAGSSDVLGAPAALQQAIRQAEQTAGLPNRTWNVWPNDYLAKATYATAALRVARAYYQAHDLTGMRRSLLEVLRIQPDNASAALDLSALNRS